MRKFFLMTAVAATVQAALAASPFDGKWTVHVGEAKRTSVEVALSDGKGTWTMYGSGSISRDNPCMNKRLPVVVKSATDTEVSIDIDGNSVLNGCLTGNLVLHPGADGTWTGVLPGGAAMTWAR